MPDLVYVNPTRFKHFSPFFFTTIFIGSHSWCLASAVDRTACAFKNHSYQELRRIPEYCVASVAITESRHHRLDMGFSPLKQS